MNASMPITTSGIKSSKIISRRSPSPPSIKLREFQIQRIAPSSSWIILGPPGSGKTTFIENLLYFNKHIYPTGRVICSVPQTRTKYKQIFGCKRDKRYRSIFVASKFDEKAEQKVITRQKTLIKREQEQGGSKPASKYMAYVLDDVDLKKAAFGTTFFTNLFKQGSRHYNMLTILGNQYVLEFPSEIRDSASYIVIFRFPNPATRKKLFQHFAGGHFESEKMFNDAMNTFTGNYKCLIISNLVQSNNIEDCVFWYQTMPIQKKWEFGCKEFRNYNKARCYLDTEDDDLIF
jgi:energy-coupling factor transporter ATP-binding protein EcfA2